MEYSIEKQVKKNIGDKQKTSYKMVDLNSATLIITLHVNSQNEAHRETGDFF